MTASRPCFGCALTKLIESHFLSGLNRQAQNEVLSTIAGTAAQILSDVDVVAMDRFVALIARNLDAGARSAARSAVH